MPKDNLTILGERLRAARNKANLTQEQLSDRSHVSIKHIAGIEKGQKNPSFEILQALAEALDLSLDNLIEKKSQCRRTGLEPTQSLLPFLSARNAGNAVKHNPGIYQGTDCSCRKDG